MLRIKPSDLFVFFLVVPLLFAGGCGDGKTQEAPSEASREKVTNVVVETLAPRDLEERFTLPGTLEAWEDILLAAETSGPVHWIGPEEGERVKEGEPILRIDPETRQANLSRAEAEYDLRKKKAERFEKLVAENLVSRQEYEEAVNAFEVASADLRLARLDLEKSTVKSPIDGSLDRLDVDPGEYVSAGDPVALIVRTDRLKVLVEVPEKDVSYLKTGETVKVTQAAIQREDPSPKEGTIFYLAYRADPLTKTYLAKVEIENRDGSLRPGMIVRISALRRELPQVIAIPIFALVERDGQKLAYVEEDGIARMRKVRVEAVIGDVVVVSEGLAAGDHLIVKGQHLVGDGSRVAAVGE